MFAWASVLAGTSVPVHHGVASLNIIGVKAGLNVGIVGNLFEIFEHLSFVCECLCVHHLVHLSVAYLSLMIRV